MRQFTLPEPLKAFLREWLATEPCTSRGKCRGCCETRIVNALLVHAIHDDRHRYLLEGDRAHPLLKARLREMAAIGPADLQGVITIKLNNCIWRVVVSFLSAGKVELVAQPTEKDDT